MSRACACFHPEVGKPEQLEEPHSNNNADDSALHVKLWGVCGFGVDAGRACGGALSAALFTEASERIGPR